MNSGLFKTVCYGIAIAMGVAVIVTNIVAPMSTAGMGTALGIAVAVLGIAGLQRQ